MENFNQNVVEQNNSQYIPNSHYVAPEPDGGHKKRFGIVILVIILLLLLGGGVYGYFYKIADVNLEKVMSSFEKVNSVQFQIKANFDLIPKKIEEQAVESSNLMLSSYPNLTNGLIPQDPAKGELTIVGASDVIVENSSKGWAKLSLLNQTKEKNNKYELELMYKNKVNYFRVNSLATTTVGSFDLGFLTNRWIKIDTSANREKGGISDLFGMVEEKKAEIVEEKKDEIAKAENEFKDLLFKNPVLIITKKFIPTRLNGDFVYHVAYKINEENLRKILMNVYGLDKEIDPGVEPSDPLFEFIKENNKVTQENNNKKMESTLADLKDVSGEIWLGIGDLLPRQITFNLVSENKDQYQKLDFKGVANFSNYNVPVEVVVPEESTSIDQIVGELFTKLLGGMAINEKDSDSKRFSDVRQIQTALELYYTDHGSYPVVTDTTILGASSSACFNDNGFSSSGCDFPYMAVVPWDQRFGYTYESVDGSSYIMSTYLEYGVDGYQAGEIFFTPNEIKQNQNALDSKNNFSSINENGDVLLIGPEANFDSDKDGLPDLIEKKIGTDINNPDTDGDGYSDNTEYINGYNPLKK